MFKSVISVSEDKIVYSETPQDSVHYTDRLDQEYTKYAAFYDRAVKLLPIWKTWIGVVVPHIQGPRVLEASFGTGYLLTQYAASYDTYGIDYNAKMVKVASKNIEQKGIPAKLLQANVEALPFSEEYFDTVINTMALSGYPDGRKAMAEFHRVLKPGGKLLLVDFEYPSNRNWFGYILVKLMERAGDVIKPIANVLGEFNFDYSEQEIGGFGSVHFYIARKKSL